MNKDISMSVAFDNPPKNQTESNKIASRLATGNYPAGLDGCFVTATTGGCGVECFVYQNGDCPEPAEFLENKAQEMISEDIKFHKDMYDD